MSSLGGFLREVVTCESLAILGQNFTSLTYSNCRDLPHVLNVLSEKSIFEKDPVLPIEKFLSLVLSRNVIWFQHLIIQYTLYYLSSGRLWEVKNKRKFQTFSSKSGRWHLQEVPNIQQRSDLETFGVLENW